MENKEVKALVERYKTGQSTGQEKSLLESWYLVRDTNAIKDITEEQFKADLTTISEGLPLYHPAKVTRLWPRIAAAAVVLVFMSIGGYFLLHKEKAATALVAQKPAQDIPPGGNKATLTLADGKTISISDVSNGRVATQGNTNINKSADGGIIYANVDGSPADHTKGLLYNTLSVPRGGQHHFVLSDGTVVWLNAASSLRYPVRFSGTDRRVELIGEGYFEVAKNARKPFIVSAAGQEVKVLGTHFNINAYTDEPRVKTTLLEGSIQLSKGGKHVLLQPGQQALTLDNAFRVNDIDTEEAVAWKNGYFMFAHEDVKSVMRKISRWYNVDIKYKGDIPKQSLSGTMTRFGNASEVLHMLELAGLVHFKIEDRRIVVMP